VLAWTTSDATVATIDAQGQLTALVEGLVYVRAEAEGQRDSVLVRVTRSWSAIAAGWGGTCALRPDASLYCWNGPSGSLTVGPNPTVVDAQAWSAVSIGVSSACSIDPNGAAYCWGRNDSPGGPLLGIGHSAGTAPKPEPVVGLLTFSQISSGDEHRCGVATGGTGYCWGRNKHGEIGDSTLLHATIPTAVHGGHSWLWLEADGYTTCGLQSDGTAWCWGVNPFGYLGVDSTEIDVLAPSPVYGNMVFSTLSVGGTHQCALKIDGTAWCWGYNDRGQLGLGTVDPMWPPYRSPQAVVGGRSYVALSAGIYHTCALRTDGVSWCWGLDEPTPVMIPGRRFVQISAGRNSCGVTEGGAAYCWLGAGGTPLRVRDP
jgi:alpha-tubulin suppressor-like RCC1 family protein